MSLTVKHINADASFLLSFEPAEFFDPSNGPSRNAFTILLDPWLSGPSTIWHPKFSVSTHKEPSCVSSLIELPEPDLVIISQDKTDHCHEPTLRTLPASGTKTVIVAEPAAFKVIRSWKYFAQEKLATVPKWEEPSSPSDCLTPNPTVFRLPIKPLDDGGAPGEVTVAFIKEKIDITGLHAAIGITYRAPTSSKTHTLSPLAYLPLTPPASPAPAQRSFLHGTGGPSASRAISVIFSPHGINYRYLAPYASSHLISEAALPLTALLHCFDRINNPWYLGGNICAGFPSGVEIAQNLLARCWISAHDGDKTTRGIASSRIMTTTFGREEIEEVVSPRSEKFPEQRVGTEVVVLGIGEEIHF